MGVVLNFTRDSFRAEARWQGRCQHPDCPDRQASWHPHHVVYEQEVRRRDPSEAHNPANAMRLCLHCHGRHHNRQAPVPLRVIRDETIDWAIGLMGWGPAFNYFNRYYDNAANDPRLREAA